MIPYWLRRLATKIALEPDVTLTCRGGPLDGEAKTLRASALHRGLGVQVPTMAKVEIGFGTSTYPMFGAKLLGKYVAVLQWQEER